MLVKSSITPVWCSQIKWGRWLSPKTNTIWFAVFVFYLPGDISLFWDFFIVPWAHCFYRFHWRSQMGVSRSKGFLSNLGYPEFTVGYLWDDRLRNIPTFEDPNFLGWLPGPWKTLSLDTIDFILFQSQLFFTTGACLSSWYPIPPVGTPSLYVSQHLKHQHHVSQSIRDTGLDKCILDADVCCVGCHWFYDPGMAWSPSLGAQNGMFFLVYMVVFRGWFHHPQIAPVLGPWNIWRLGRVRFMCMFIDFSRENPLGTNKTWWRRWAPLGSFDFIGGQPSLGASNGAFYWLVIEVVVLMCENHDVDDVTYLVCPQEWGKESPS